MCPAVGLTTYMFPQLPCPLSGGSQEHVAKSKWETEVKIFLWDKTGSIEEERDGRVIDFYSNFTHSFRIKDEYGFSVFVRIYSFSIIC